MDSSPRAVLAHLISNRPVVVDQPLAAQGFLNGRCACRSEFAGREQINCDRLVWKAEASAIAPVRRVRPPVLDLDAGESRHYLDLWSLYRQLKVLSPRRYVEPGEDRVERNSLHAFDLKEGVRVDLHMHPIKCGFSLCDLQLILQMVAQTPCLLPLCLAGALNVLEPNDLSPQPPDPLDAQGNEQPDGRPHGRDACRKRCSTWPPSNG
ncbi:MAG: hypothetical protein JWN81_370 [Solirubrobacterales bacterium]|nr:hypothetical protein [Solirubrobacterales bacterium]